MNSDLKLAASQQQMCQLYQNVERNNNMKLGLFKCVTYTTYQCCNLGV